ncbi:HXXEE domain-containing protein [Streptomyces sp. NPDC049881]|uniref:HXXEE domain-containing protein n=1 Tax=Streptomyces sp. NPDC049881 TaxID=3155778 RepID=UPI00344510CE
MTRPPGWGLLAVWALHDAEELARVGRWTAERLPALRDEFPWVPERVWRALSSVDEREFAAAVGLMGLLVAAVAREGRRTGGRSAVYRAAVDGFGLHGVVHLAQAAAVRAWTPGAATSAALVVPWSLWARARLRAAGAPPVRARDAVAGLALAAGAVAGSHAVARRLVRGRA